MTTVVLVIHLMVAASLVGLVLLQRSEGGALGIGGGGGGGGGFMTGRGTADLLTRATAVVAAMFFVTSLALAVLAKKDTAPKSIFDEVKTEAGPAAPASGPGDAGNKPGTGPGTSPWTGPGAGTDADTSADTSAETSVDAEPSQSSNEPPGSTQAANDDGPEIERPQAAPKSAGASDAPANDTGGPKPQDGDPA